MSRSSWDDDVRLLLDLGTALDAARAAPDRIVEIGRAAYVWRTVDAELAELTFDSAAGPADPDGTAGPNGGGGGGDASEGGAESSSDGVLAGARASVARLRAMTFTANDLSIELEVTDDGLVGQLVPPAPGHVELRARHGGMLAADADTVGWFDFELRPSGTFQLHVRLAAADRRQIVTEWFTV
jgi:hypothetical protein